VLGNSCGFHCFFDLQKERKVYCPKQNKLNNDLIEVDEAGEPSMRQLLDSRLEILDGAYPGASLEAFPGPL
jgi:hypothetical protein